MNDDLDQVRQIFVSEVDDELRAENEAQIKDWEEGLIHSQAMQGWQSHDITKEIAKGARDSYKSIALMLANNRELTEQQRYSLWGRQDAMKWLLTLIEEDAKGELERINQEIKAALNATN